MPGRLSRKRRASNDFEEQDSRIEHNSRIEDGNTVESEGDGRDTQAGPSSTEDLAKKLIRLALAQESQRRPLRRQEISDKVLGNAGRQFKKVFAQAQEELRAVFGMELVELPARERLTIAQRRAAQQKIGQSKPQTTAWILTSILPFQYRSPAILPPSSIPNSEAEGTYTGLYSILVALVFLNGGLITDTRLDRFLSRLHLDEAIPLEGAEKTDVLLKRVERDGYLIKIREKLGATGEEEISWTLGPRAKVEIGKSGVKALVEEVYGPLDDAAGEDLGKKLDRSLGALEISVDTPAAGESQQTSRHGKQRSRRSSRSNRSDNDDDDDDDNDGDE